MAFIIIKNSWHIDQLQMVSYYYEESFIKYKNKQIASLYSQWHSLFLSFETAPLLWMGEAGWGLKEDCFIALAMTTTITKGILFIKTNLKM